MIFIITYTDRRITMVAISMKYIISIETLLSKKLILQSMEVFMDSTASSGKP